MKYFEAFGEGGFHSAFMTTYAFGALAFEDIPFAKLRGAGCRNITVLADRGMVNQAFSEFGPPRFAGTSYHLVKADAPGVFHPKITMLIGETKGRLIVGSANLTALGLGGNKEQVASIYYSSDAPENAKYFVSVLAYLRRYVPQDDQWFPVCLRRAMRSAPWLSNVNFDLAFDARGTSNVTLLLDRPEFTVLDQIVASIGEDTVKRLVIVSPYWDAELRGLALLRLALDNPVTDILIDGTVGGFPASMLSSVSNVSLFDVSPQAEGRFLHAKLIIAQGERWDHVISGSMNCTFPALMGSTTQGNAEAGIYKRLVRSTAIEALGLESYQNVRIVAGEFTRLQQSFENAPTFGAANETAADGGSLTLKSGRLSWTAPERLSEAPVTIQIYDRDSRNMWELGTENGLAAWDVSSDAARPKYGIVKFASGAMSAPVQVVDLDYLAVTTLPPQRGHKRRLMDTLLESSDEDLDLIEVFKQLEVLEAEDRAHRSGQTPRAKPQAADVKPPIHEVLSYDDFIRARTNANAQGKPFGLYLNSRNDSAASLMSTCLNRMIGLVGPDLRVLEDECIDAFGSIDFRTTEPQSVEDSGIGDTPPESVSPAQAYSKQIYATTKKFQEAVSAFEARGKDLADKAITSSEMVRLRALLQIILAYAQPIEGAYSPAQILPVYTVDGYDWPRLIGRLLRQHFSATRALQNLTVEEDEAEQQRVLEYLAFANWSASAAYIAVRSNKKAAFLLTLLEPLMASISEQTQAILSVFEGDRIYFQEITAKLDTRFKDRLGLSGIDG